MDDTVTREFEEAWNLLKQRFPPPRGQYLGPQMGQQTTRPTTQPPQGSLAHRHQQIQLNEELAQRQFQQNLEAARQQRMAETGGVPQQFPSQQMLEQTWQE